MAWKPSVTLKTNWAPLPKEDFSLKDFKYLLKKNILLRNAPVVFSGGEPTLIPQLIDMVALLRQKGYREILLQTNGRMLCYEDFCLRLIRAGVSGFGISINGSSAAVHERMTRMPGSFHQTMTGLKNLLAIKHDLPHLKITTHTTLTKINLTDLAALLNIFIGKQGIDTIVLNPLWLQGNAIMHHRQLLVPYTDIALKFKRAIKKVTGSNNLALPKISITDFPFCVAADLMDYIGTPEQGPVIGHDETIPHTGLKTGPPNIKNRMCRTCCYFSVCAGIPPLYIAKFGWGEFHPVAHIKPLHKFSK